jgi:Glyoxalase-like domain
MFTAIDHLVIVVPELERAMRDYSASGFTVVRGGKHNVGTHNALIALADGSYIELIAFLKPVAGHRWYTALEKGGGLVDFCMQTDNLTADADAMRRAGVAIGMPIAMTRERPDGHRFVGFSLFPNLH